jgi:putative membrane protein
MRWINLAIVCLFAAGMIIFAFQNVGAVTVSFLSFSLRAPLAILVFVVYVAGAATGGNLFALLRRSYRGARLGPGIKLIGTQRD